MRSVCVLRLKHIGAGHTGPPASRIGAFAKCSKERACKLQSHLFQTRPYVNVAKNLSSERSKLVGRSWIQMPACTVSSFKVPVTCSVMCKRMSPRQCVIGHDVTIERLDWTVLVDESLDLRIGCRRARSCHDNQLTATAEAGAPSAANVGRCNTRVLAPI